MSAKPRTGSNAQAYNATPNASPANETEPHSGGPTMSGHGQWHGEAMQEAMNVALWKIDEHVLEAPRACRTAVTQLVGSRGWGSFLFDQSPLIRVYLDSVWRLDMLGLIDPGREVRELLDGCVAHAKQNEHPAFVLSVEYVNPVEFLAGLLGAAVGLYLQTYADTYADLEECAKQEARGQGHAGESI